MAKKKFLLVPCVFSLVLLLGLSMIAASCDNGEGTDSQSLSIVSFNVSAETDNSVCEGTITVNAVSSAGSDLEYEWSISDGVINNVNENKTSFSVQDITGTFTIGVRVTDQNNQIINFSVQVTVSEGGSVNAEVQENTNVENDANTQTNSANSESQYNIVDVVFSPNGNSIIFSSNHDGNFEIYMMNTDGSGLTNLTNNAAIDFNASFSPNGNSIIFTSNRDGNFEIYMMNTDGSGLTNLTNNSLSNDMNASFSSDGNSIIFTSDSDGTVDIYVMNSDGSGITNISNSVLSGVSGSQSQEGQVDSQSGENVQEEDVQQQQSQSGSENNSGQEATGVVAPAN